MGQNVRFLVLIFLASAWPLATSSGTNADEHASIVSIVFAASKSLPTSSTNYVWCHVNATFEPKRAFYSDVFATGDSNSARIGAAFERFVQAHYENRTSGTECFFNHDLNGALKDESVNSGRWQRLGFDIIETRWTYSE